jgi:hypothetical protein
MHIVSKHLLIPAVRNKIEELIRASDIAHKLEGHHYFSDELSQFKLRLEATLEEDNTKEIYFWLHEESIEAQTRSVFKEHNATNFEVDNIVKHFIAMIDNNSPIAIKVWRKK